MSPLDLETSMPGHVVADGGGTSVVDVLSSAELTDEPRRVDVDGTPVVIARVGDEVLAAVDRCPHRGAPLSAGAVVHDCIVCPYHGWAFDSHGEIAAIPALGADARLP